MTDQELGQLVRELTIALLPVMVAVAVVGTVAYLADALRQWLIDADIERRYRAAERLYYATTATPPAPPPGVAVVDQDDEREPC